MLGNYITKDEFEESGGAGSVKLVGERHESGVWTLSGLKVGVPLYFIGRCTTRHDVYATIRITSGSLGLWDSNDNPIGYSIRKGNNGSLTCVPTSSVVTLQTVFNVAWSGSTMHVYAYQ